MFQNKTILILANSVRDGKHCVAGKVVTQSDGQFTLTKEWIRLSNPCDAGRSVGVTWTSNTSFDDGH